MTGAIPHMGLCSRQASLGFFLSIFQSDLSLHIVASSCDSPTDFTLWASREGCLVTEYVNKLLLKMSPRSPLVSCHVNNGAVPMRENGGRVADISAHFFFGPQRKILLPQVYGRSSLPLVVMWLCPVVTKE